MDPNPPASSRSTATDPAGSAASFYDALFGGTTDAILVADADARYVGANDAALELLGYSLAEITTLGVSDLIADSTTQTEAEIERLIAEGSWRGELAIRRKDGALRFVEARATVLRTTQGDRYITALRDISETRHRLDALSESEARFRNVFESNMIGIGILAAGGVVTEANSALLSLLGYSRQDLRDGRLHQSALTPPEYRQLDERALIDMRRHGHCTPYEKALIRKDGRHVPVIAGGALLGPSQEGGVFFALDIEQRKRAENGLRLLVDAGNALATSLDYETTLQTVAQLAVPAFADWCVVRVVTENGSLRGMAAAHRDPEMARLARETIELFPVDMAAPVGVAQVVRTGQAELSATMTPAQFVTSARDDEHRRRLLAFAPSSHMMVPLVAHGRTFGAISFALLGTERRYSRKDLTIAEELSRRCALAIERARLQGEEREAVAARERVYRALADASRAFDEPFDDEHAVAAAIARYASQVVGDAATVWLKSDDRQSIANVAVHHADPEAEKLLRQAIQGDRYPIIESVARTGTAARLEQVTTSDIRRHVPGLRRYAEERGIESLLVVPLRARGNQIGALSISRDQGGSAYTRDDQTLLQELTDRAALSIENARLMREARAAVRTRDEFIAVVSHDLRSPLAAILGFAQLLQRRVTRGIEARDVVPQLQQIERTAQRMVGLLEEMLDVTRGRPARRLSPDAPAIDLVGLAQRAIAGHEASTRKHRFCLEAPESGCTGIWDSARLERVLDNLIGNAVKYSPDGGEIRIAIASESNDEREWAILRVSDGGIGIPAGEIGRIFERFQRARNAVDRFPGLGIGLAGVRQIVEEHGGSVSVESREGYGTTFSVRLPVAPIEPPTTEAPSI